MNAFQLRYRKNHERYLRNIQKRRHTRTKILQGLKDKPCVDCHKKFHFSCMDFDHRPGTIKKFNISHAVTYASEKINSEIAKCDLVCANCHRIRTYKRLEEKRYVRTRI